MFRNCSICFLYFTIYIIGYCFSGSGCPTNWVSDSTYYPNICYYQTSTTDDFNTANTYCLVFGSNLPSFQTVNEYISYQQVIMQHYSNAAFPCDQYIYLGISSTNNSQWTDGTDVTISYYTNYMANLCTVHVTTGGSWLSVPCSNQYRYVCQMRLTSATYTITTPTSLLVTGNCPNGWYSDIYGICYLYVNNNLTWDCAEAYCESMAATLPRFNNNSELASFYNILEQTFFHCKGVQWLGVYDPFSNRSYQWINGSSIPLSDSNWWNAGGPYLPNNRVTSYGWYYASSFYAFTETDSHTFSCQIRPTSNTFNTVNTNAIYTSICNITMTTVASTSTASQPPTTTAVTLYSGTSCPTGWLTDPVYPYICYLVPQIYKTFDNANAYCKSIVSGASLPVFHFKDEYFSYHQLMVTNTSVGCNEAHWLGISNIPAYPNQKHDKWIDGTNVTFNYFASTVWDLFYHFATGGAWYSVWSGMSDTYHFVCQLRLTNYVGTTIAPLPTTPLPSYCPSGWSVDVYGICYKFFFSSFSTWDQALKNCQIYPGGSLAQFCNESEQIAMNNVLAAMIVPCNEEFWVGIYDPVGDGSFIYINGSYVGKNGFNNFQCNSANTRVASLGWQYNLSSYVARPTSLTNKYVCQIRPGNDCFTNAAAQVTQTSSSPLCQLPTTTASTTVPTTTQLTTPTTTQLTTTTTTELPTTTTQLTTTTTTELPTTTTLLTTIITQMTTSTATPTLSTTSSSISPALSSSSVGSQLSTKSSVQILGTTSQQIQSNSQQLLTTNSLDKQLTIGQSLTTTTPSNEPLTNGQSMSATTGQSFMTNDDTTLQSFETNEMTTTINSSNLFLLTSGLEQLGFDPTDGNDTVALSAKIKDTTPFILQPLSDSMKKQLGYSFEQLVLQSSYNSVPCTAADFQDLYNPQLGNCFIFNTGQNSTHWTNQPGSIYGLRLVLAALQTEYTCMSSYAGFKLVIHENNIMPFPDVQGYNIGLETVTLINLRQERVNKLGYPYGNCASSSFDNYIKNYSVEACQRYCFQNALMESCGCADPRYPLPNQGIYCGIEQKLCLDYFQSCESVVTTACNCATPCNEIIYAATLTTGILFEPNRQAMFCDEQSNSTDCDGGSDNGYSVVYVYYQELNVLVNTENSSYGLYLFFCDFSNIIGTLLGIGIITFVEFGCMLVLFTISCLKKMK